MSKPSKGASNAQTIVFVVVLCSFCALVLASLSTALQESKDKAEELNRAQEMLLSAGIYHSAGYLQMYDKMGNLTPAKLGEGGKLFLATKEDLATADEIFSVARDRINAFLVDDKGRRFSFEEAHIDKSEYIDDNKKRGYSSLPLKLVYEVSPNGVKASEMQKKGVKPIGYIFAVNGFGLWDAIYGYLAIAPDGNTVLGISWYEQKETPGLGALITSQKWQKQFPGKKIFQEGLGDLATAPLGITVVRGKVVDTLGSSPKAKSAVDGMAGATLTGNGVTKAYKESLAGYRPFLLSLNKGKA